jgi:hypothetical protein
LLLISIVLGATVFLSSAQDLFYIRVFVSSRDVIAWDLFFFF